VSDVMNRVQRVPRRFKAPGELEGLRHSWWPRGTSTDGQWRWSVRTATPTSPAHDARLQTVSSRCPSTAPVTTRHARHRLASLWRRSATRQTAELTTP